MKNASTPKSWTEEELQASVITYLEMLKLSQAGKKFNKKKYYEELATRFDRTVGAFEYRMKNISYVLYLMDRNWLPGLKPAKNVGTNVGKQIEKLIADSEGVTSSIATFKILVQEEIKKKRHTPPLGNVKPKTTMASSTQYQRSPAIKAWVLNRAHGICECCHKAAPFLDYEGNHYLETHHIKRLTDGGSDTITNTVAVCPNCHSELHYGINAKKLAEALYNNISQLIRE